MWRRLHLEVSAEDIW